MWMLTKNTNERFWLIFHCCKQIDVKDQQHCTREIATCCKSVPLYDVINVYNNFQQTEFNINYCPNSKIQKIINDKVLIVWGGFSRKKCSRVRALVMKNLNGHSQIEMEDKKFCFYPDIYIANNIRKKTMASDAIPHAIFNLTFKRQTQFCNGAMSCVNHECF